MNKSQLLLSIAPLLLALQSNAHAWEYSLTTEYSSIYEFRGSSIGDNLLSSSFTASSGKTFSQGELSLGLWTGALNDSDAAVDGELDLSIAWSQKLMGISTELGFIHYNYPQDSSLNTNEFYLSLNKEIGAGIAATVTAYYDTNLTEGWFFYGDLGRSFEISETFSVSLSAGIGMHQSAAGFADGIGHHYVKLSGDWKLNDNLSVSPFIKFTNAASDYASAYTKTVPSGKDLGGELWNVGVAFSYAF